MIGVPVRRSSMATQQADRLGAISHGMGGGGLPGFERVDEVPAHRSMADSSFTAQSTLKRNAAGFGHHGIFAPAICSSKINPSRKKHLLRWDFGR